jgi:hypothetical protein
MSTTFDYEFVFSTGVFDQVVYDACTIQDTLGGRQQVIQDTVAQIQNIFNNMSSLNLHQFSTFAAYENKNYKVTVANPSWGQ